MNKTILSNKKQNDTDAIWDIYKSAHSELTELVNESLALQKQLNEIRSKAGAKANLIKALQTAMRATAEDEIPLELLKSPILVAEGERVSPAHRVVRRILSTRPPGVLSAADFVKSPEVLNIGIEPKAIYNVLNYLAQKGDLEKIDRGKYLIRSSGVGVDSSVEIACHNEKDTQ